MKVRILSGALDEHDGRMVLRGAIDPTTLEGLMVDDYQRKVLPVTSLKRIMKGFESGSAVPDVELGMRGAKKAFRDGVYTLHDDVYIIDGLQRITAAKLYMGDGKVPHLGCTIHFNTTKEWERAQFKILNSDRTRVSSNVIIRNFRDDFDAIKALFTLANDDREFVMRGKVSWDQSLGRNELISCSTLVKTAMALHSHLSECSSYSSAPEELCSRTQKVADVTGKNMFRGNIRTYFDVLDACWHVRNVAFKEKSPFLRSTFLLTLAKVFSNHDVFWREQRLLVDVDFRRKLEKFPVFDPAVVNLASSGTHVDRELYRMIVEHLNKGKRHRRLYERRVMTDSPETTPAADGGEEAVG